VLSSNLGLVGCENAPSSGQSQRISDEPVITRPNATASTETTAEAPLTAPVAPHDCHAGYVATGNALRDVLRVGLMCGPSNGLAKEPRVAGKQARSLSLEAGECVWVAAAARGVAGRVELQWVSGDQVLADCELKGLGLCPRVQPLCVQRFTEVNLLVAEGDGAAPAAVEIWARRHRFTP
jgi:hypothetical protein